MGEGGGAVVVMVLSSEEAEEVTRLGMTLLFGGVALRCLRCGNMERFQASGYFYTAILDDISGMSGEVEDYHQDEEGYAEYDAVICEECGAEVRKEMRKEEADAIIMLSIPIIWDFSLKP